MKKSILIILVVLLYSLLFVVNGSHSLLISLIVMGLLGLLMIFDYVKSCIEFDPKWKERWEDFEYDVYHFYPIEKVRNFYHNVTSGVVNIFKWWRIVWNDRDYNYCFILRMMEFKLKSMEKFFNSENTWNKNSERYVKQIMIAKNLCKRITKSSDYFNNAMINHYRKYGCDLKLEFKPVEGEPGCMQMINNRSEEENKSFTKASEHADYMRNQDVEFLFVYLKKHLLSWWD